MWVAVRAHTSLISEAAGSPLRGDLRSGVAHQYRLIPLTKLVIRSRKSCAWAGGGQTHGKLF